MQNFNVPILLLVFNRPDTTRVVLERISKIRPSRLYVAADGPRHGRANDSVKCQEVRALFDNINWPCEVITLFRQENLGCKEAVSQAITWFFDSEEEGIVLEDDCLPDETFFSFCEQMLLRYRDDKRIMHIGGTNFQQGVKRGNASYYFSRIGHVWGWASWRRAWQHYDIALKNLEQVVERGLFHQILLSQNHREHFINNFRLVRDGKIDTWDYQWVFSIWQQNGLCIIPNNNLVSNIGFGEDATHTIDADNKFACIESLPLAIVAHPEIVLADNAADEFTLAGSGNASVSLLRRLVRAVIRGRIKKHSLK